MGEISIGWRVVPHGRVAHWLTWNLYGDRHRHYSACGMVYIVGYLDVKPRAKRCKRCERARAGKDGEG